MTTSAQPEKTVLLYSTDPDFFERRDTVFNRRGVDVFCAMEMDGLRRVTAQRPVNLLVSRGVPAGISPSNLLAVVQGIPVVIMAVEDDEPAALDAYQNTRGIEVIRAPYEDRLLLRSAELLRVDVRRYIRMLVQVSRPDDRATKHFAFSRNVSAGGMLIQTKIRLAIDSDVILSFLLPGTRDMTHVQGVVVRDAGAPSAGARQYGVRFTGLARATRDQIELLENENRAAAAA